VKLITVEAKGNGAVEIKIGGHSMDSTVSNIADDKTTRTLPVEMLCASLGACITLMIDDYCCRIGCKDGHAAVSMTYQMGGTPKRIETITIDIELPCDFPEEKKKAALRVAQACPIHATLSHNPHIDMDIVG
jgi:uncharacterized OsmC-like protein